MPTSIAWTIAWKDITGAVRNRTIRGNLIAALLVVVLYRSLPLLSDAGEARLVVFDEGQSETIAALEDVEDVEDVEVRFGHWGILGEWWVSGIGTPCFS